MPGSNPKNCAQSGKRWLLGDGIDLCVDFVKDLVGSVAQHIDEDK